MKPRQHFNHRQLNLSIHCTHNTRACPCRCTDGHMSHEKFVKAMDSAPGLHFNAEQHQCDTFFPAQMLFLSH